LAWLRSVTAGDAAKPFYNSVTEVGIRAGVSDVRIQSEDTKVVVTV
jgi:hypothetical protein